jgi:hypothetical protein
MITTILLGGITHHYLGSSLPYCNRINSVGTITNPYATVMSGDKESRYGFIFGTDSACGVIVGPISSFAIDNNLDFIVGAYNTNHGKFNSLGIQPPTFFGLTPVVGINYNIRLSENLSLNNIISIGIVSHALSVDF